MMIKWNRNALRDKIYACWLGKNIGGTMGTPYEGQREINDIQGFSSPPGAALPNDDLDLQLVWLRALDEAGPEGINSKVLGEYWMSYIGPHWNEYGIGKSNMSAGILPPMSGELNNYWKHSNGAWIRTEIWACAAPGCPEKAIRFAFEDACVDHGFGEGTFAAVFVAAMESAAFVTDDLRLLLRIGLSKIPAGCRVARSVKMVIDGYDQGIDWKTLRNQVVEDSSDLGWFQAPANVAFAVLGLLYGEGDFKKSMILAIDCGDDTDCTGATVGALMGIMYGMDCIPKDWSAYIGDGILTVAIVQGTGYFPKSCTELTDCVMNLIPAVTRTSNPAYVRQGGPDMIICEEAQDLGGVDPEAFCGSEFLDSILSRSPYSYTIESVYTDVLVEFDGEPVIQPGGEKKVKVTFLLKRMPEQKHFYLRWILPEGFSVSGGKRDVYADTVRRQEAFVEVTITAGETVAPQNRIILEAVCPGRPLPLLIPVTIQG